MVWGCDACREEGAWSADREVVTSDEGSADGWRSGCISGSRRLGVCSWV